MRGHRCEGVTRGLPADVVIAPWRVVREVQKLLMRSISKGRIGACAGCDGLDALSLTVAEHALGLECERFAPALPPQYSTDAVEVLR